jgi:hypothetical protein
MPYRKLSHISLSLVFFIISSVAYSQVKDTLLKKQPGKDTILPTNQPIKKADSLFNNKQTNEPIIQPINPSNDKTNEPVTSPTTNQPIVPPSQVVTPPDSTTSDGLFQLARKAAFDEKNYPKAKNYLYRALALSPDYADIHGQIRMTVPKQALKEC